MKFIIRPMAFFAADNKFVGVKRLYYICDAHYYEMRRHIFLEKRFVLYPLQEIANFKTTRIEAVEKRSCLSHIHSPTRGLIYGMAWEWTVYPLLGVWRCLL